MSLGTRLTLKPGPTAKIIPPRRNTVPAGSVQNAPCLLPLQCVHSTGPNTNHATCSYSYL